jgi:uncharacterized membrane protein
MLCGGIRSMMNAEDVKSRRAVVIGIIVALAAVLRFFRLGYQSFWIDEILTIGSYSSPEGGVPYRIKLLWDVHGPLYSLVMHIWSMVRSSEAWLRAPGAAAGVITVVLMYLWLKRLSDEGTATAGALLMAVNPFNVYYSQELRFYSFLTMFVVLSLLVFSYFNEKPSFRSGLLLGITLGFACLSHFMAVFLCMGLALYIVVTGRLKGNHLKYGALAALLTVAIVSPWIYRQIFFLSRIRATDPSQLPVVYRMEGKGPSALMTYPYGLYAFAMGYSYGPDLRELHEASSVSFLLKKYWLEIGLSALLFGAAAISGLARLFREKNSALFLSVLAATAGLVTASAMLKIKVLNVRYFMCAFPVFIAIVACGIPRSKRAATLTVSLLAILMLYSTINYHFYNRYARDDIRGAVDIISKNERPGDLILAPGMEPVVSYYYRGIRPVESIYAAHLDRYGVERILHRITEGRRRVWLVRCRPWDTDADGHILSLLDGQTNLISKAELPGISLILYEMPRRQH